MIIKNLSGHPQDALVATFLEAFEGYFVKMPTDPEYYRNRWVEEGVDMSLSFGAFAGERLIGFMLHAVDRRGGSLLAHNAATGIIPESRGNGEVGKIYDQALPDLTRHGIQHLSLEVICENTRAVRAYEKAGFRVGRTLHSFLGPIESRQNRDIELQRKMIYPEEWESKDQGKVSWGNHAHCFSDASAEYYEVSLAGDPIGFFVIGSGRDRIYQFDTYGGNGEEMDLLIGAMGSISSGSVRIINVDEGEVIKLERLRASGMPKYVDQFEMYKDI